MKIANNVYTVMGLSQKHPAGVNAGFVVVGDKIIYIDSGWTIMGAQTIYGYSKAAAPLSNPKMVLFTDKHLDHISGMKVFRDAGAELVGHQKLNELLQGDLIQNYKNIAKQTFADDANAGEIVFRDVHLYPLDRTINSEETIQLDNEEFVVIPTPGHNNACLSIYLPNSKILFAGDAIYSEFPPNTKFGDKGLWQEWICSLQRLERLEIEKIVPGHGRICDKSEIRRNMRYLEELLEREK
jgi:glyoxylase-like metal-dependent hydrolase (beta-lactamase superfamily II)